MGERHGRDASAGANGPWRLVGTLLPADEPVELWVVDGVFVPGPVAGATTICDGGWIMPGFVDAHSHIGLGRGGAVDMGTAREQAVTDRDGGALLIRDAGSPIDTHEFDRDPELPRIVRAGRHIARPRRYIAGYAAEIEPGELVDEVERQARAGDGWVKIVGDWIDRSIGDLAPLWDSEEAAAAIARAHRLGARVTAHCFAEESVVQLVDAGIDGIEHGTGMSGAVIDTMAARRVALVPTMINLATFGRIADAGQAKYPVYAAHMRALGARYRQVLASAYEAGVPIYAGTDAGGTIEHGRISDEISALSTIGGAEFALGAASWRARSWLGRSGIQYGASADLVVLGADPRGDVSICASPELIVLRGVPHRHRAGVHDPEPVG
ncbi:amidohydrolase family protein [uncultured Propionibacterium sp.]|uniref:amidohydrolase family protein n=1 Tax=uncultured Propionibacterium sp. TaxID=218066 RepID=UPI00292E56CF|nr:amidohydrolase family protein [uncultured Propionibacterium sp.]